MLGDYSKVAEEVKKEMQKGKQFTGQEDGEYVSIHSFDMLSQSYDAKFAECEMLKAENRKLTAEVSKYRYFIECQRNEMDKLNER